MRTPAVVIALVGAAGLVFGVSAALSGCAYDWSFPGDGVDLDADGATTDVRADDAVDSSVVEVSVPETRPPIAGDCRTTTDCRGGEYCAFPDHACGKGGAGKCALVPTACGAGELACGCSGTVYDDVCSAAQKGEDLSADETLACSRAGFFRCGTSLCKEASQFCLNDAKAVPQGFKCVFFDGCATSDCACSVITKLGCSSCSEKTAGQVRVVCP